MNYEPLYKFSHILDEHCDDKDFQMGLILIRLALLQGMFIESKTDEVREMLYDDISALNDLYGKLFKEHRLTSSHRMDGF